VQLTEKLNGRKPVFPVGGTISQMGDDWVQFFSEDVQGYNPRVMQKLVDDGFGILSLYEVPRSLEQVYLQAVAAPKDGQHA